MLDHGDCGGWVEDAGGVLPVVAQLEAVSVFVLFAYLHQLRVITTFLVLFIPTSLDMINLTKHDQIIYFVLDYSCIVFSDVLDLVCTLSQQSFLA